MHISLHHFVPIIFGSNALYWAIALLLDNEQKNKFAIECGITFHRSEATTVEVEKVSGASTLRIKFTHPTFIRPNSATNKKAHKNS
jgi:hypothetical protein